MNLASISPTEKNTGICESGWHLYRNPYKDTIPISYALRIMTKKPRVYLYVKVPITDELNEKIKELKKRCLASTYHMVEVTFTDLVFEYHSEKLTEKGLEITKYVARATDFHFVEED